jgi:hypothetical protein
VRRLPVRRLRLRESVHCWQHASRARAAFGGVDESSEVGQLPGARPEGAVVRAVYRVAAGGAAGGAAGRGRRLWRGRRARLAVQSLGGGRSRPARPSAIGLVQARAGGGGRGARARAQEARGLPR